MRFNAPGARMLRHSEAAGDRVGRTIELNGQALVLSARERALLEIFLAQPGRMVSKPEIIGLMSERGETPSANAVEVYVHRLRRKLAPGGVKIYTVRGLGYCLGGLDDR